MAQRLYVAPSTVRTQIKSIYRKLGVSSRNVWAFRYSSEGQSQTLSYSIKVQTLREMYPDRPRLQEVSDETRIIVSEPLVELAGAWNEVPESSYGLVCKGEDELRTFRPAR